MKVNLTLTLWFVLLLVSCSQYKKVASGSYVYKVVDNQAQRDLGVKISDSAFVYKVNGSFKALLKDKTEYQLISPKGNAKLIKIDSIKITSFDGFRKDIKNQLYFAESKLFDHSRGLRYWDSKLVLQGISIPLKIRPELVKDSLPKQAESGVNFGVAIGWKFNYNVLKKDKNVFGQNFERVSLTPGFLFGLGTTDLKKNVNTFGIINDRKEPIFSCGGMIMAGYNTINIGFAIGQDRAIGDGKKQWRYHKEKWYGFIVAIDIIK